MTDRPDSRVKKWAGPVVIGLVLAVTLAPDFGRSQPISGFCLICGYRGTADAVLNVLLFLPLGVVFRWSFTRTITAVIAAILVSGAVEAAQILIPGRHPSLGDLVFNTLGATLGVVVVDLKSVFLRPGAVASRRLAALAASFAPLVLLLTGWLLQPAFPESVYYGQWTADLGHLEAYEGRILEASIGESAAPSHRLADSDAVRSQLLEGDPVRVTIEPGRRPPGLAPIFSIFDGQQREIVLYGLDDRDLVFRYRSRALSIRLDQPDLRIADAAFDPTPSSVSMIVRLVDDGFCVWVDGQELACPVAHTAGRGWAFLLYPERRVRRLHDALDFVWVVLLTLPVGWWGRRLRPTAALAIPSIAVSLVIPGAFGQMAVSPWVAAAAVIGPLLGALLARITSRTSGTSRASEPIQSAGSGAATRIRRQ